ncbi:hypothetical protein CYMTET_53651 [Cymbomonas tetramitiformis]|uniref:Uncharacterized protein n=1 Tax=Cymbomonas tetramitiformis TaxID=36881 RepID=A0AAE0EPV0_9CHLO|nr:hypothetical protein CYMTET_53651 [Cymbomonas tetramitiformis]
MDGVVSAFQTAFDDEDDGAFAELCKQHNQPLVRGESEPFTYPEALGIGLRAQYAGLARSDSPSADMRDALAEARGIQSSLQSAAARAGGSGAPLASSLNLGRTALPPVVSDVPPPTQEDERPPALPESDGTMYPVSACDPARFEAPFASINFMDNVFGQVGLPDASLNACSVVRPLAVYDPEMSVIDDEDSASDDGSDGWASEGSHSPLCPSCRSGTPSEVPELDVICLASAHVPCMCFSSSGVGGTGFTDRLAYLG